MGQTIVVKPGPMQQCVQLHQAPLPEQVPGEHLWIMCAIYKVTPAPGREFFLDTENLLTVDGPGCFWCEEPWTPSAAARRCPGVADD